MGQDDGDSAIGIEAGIGGRLSSVTTADSDSGKEQYRRSVSFANVQVREYDLCLGDNPSVSTGAPVSLDWSYKHESSCSLDEYEFEMNTFSSSSSSSFLRDRSPSERFHLLRQLGYSRDEIALASFTAKRIRDERERTVRQVERNATIRYIVDKLPFAKYCRNRRRQRKQKREEQQNQVATSSYFFENSFHTSYSMSSSSSSSSLSSSSTISETGNELKNESSLTQRRGYSLHHSVAVAPTTSADVCSEEFPKAA